MSECRVVRTEYRVVDADGLEWHQPTAYASDVISYISRLDAPVVVRDRLFIEKRDVYERDGEWEAGE